MRDGDTADEEVMPPDKNELLPEFWFIVLGMVIGSVMSVAFYQMFIV